MSDEPVDGIDVKMLTGLFDAPAYIRRVRNVEGALEHLLGRARVVREEWLAMTRMRIGVLHALVGGNWTMLRPWLADDEQVGVLERLHQTLSPTLRLPPKPTRSPRALRGALAELLESLTRFNTRWMDHLRKIDLTVVNDLREKYNRYYLLEKSCAIRNEAVVRAGFVPMTPFDLAELQQHLPLLPEPRTTL